MQLSTIIIDDEPIALEKLATYVSRVPYLTLAGRFSSATEAISFIADNRVDLIFTDINMPDLNGIEFIESLPVVPMLIFTTAYADYALDGYRLSAVDYLLKPYGFPAFQRAANKAQQLFSARLKREAETMDEDSIFVKVDYRYIRVPLSDIRYIKGYGEYLQLYLLSSVNPLLTLSSFAAIMAKLSPSFLQVHRSYIVNMGKVSHIERARIVMDHDTYIPIGDSYKAALNDFLKNHSIGKSGRRES